MIGDHYFSTGITITPESGKWHISANFASSTEGEMHLRYLVDDPVEGAKTLKEDMEALGIQFGIKEIHPSVYFPGDSDNPDFPKYVETVNKVCEALGWPNIYKKRHSMELGEGMTSMNAQRLHDILKVLKEDEYKGMTCVVMAVKMVDPNSQGAYDDMMSWLKPDFDKLRCASTNEGKELEKLIKEWRINT